VNRDHSHRLYGMVGTKLHQNRAGGPHNCLVLMDDGEEVVAPWGNWRKEPEPTPRLHSTPIWVFGDPT
jgi:hypothetical protein